MTNRIIRVFPHRTSYTPTDGLVFIGRPPFREMKEISAIGAVALIFGVAAALGVVIGLWRNPRNINIESILLIVTIVGCVVWPVVFWATGQ